MNTKINPIRKSLIVIFILITIALFIGFLFLLWVTALGIGYGGGDASFLEIIWMWSGVVLIFIFSLVTTIGLIKKKKYGIIYGYPTTIGFLAYLFTDFESYGFHGNYMFSFTHVLLALLFIGLPTLIIIGLTKLKKASFELSKHDLVKIAVLSVLLVLSCYFMFD